MFEHNSLRLVEGGNGDEAWLWQQENSVLSHESCPAQWLRWVRPRGQKQVWKFSWTLTLSLDIRCYFTLGRNDEAVLDAVEASRINPDNSAAKEALAIALYASGDFERALIQFHRVYRFLFGTFPYEWMSLVQNARLSEVSLVDW